MTPAPAHVVGVGMIRFGKYTRKRPALTGPLALSQLGDAMQVTKRRWRLAHVVSKI